MSHKTIELKEGAFVISDAHFSPSRPELLDFIKAIHTKQLRPTQLILMGDIFDTLFGSINFTYTQNSEMIQLINEISHEIEVIYLEGNHDFNLQKLFVNAVVVPIQMQPIMAKYKDKKVYLAHGDFDGAVFYKLYTALIRNPFILFILKYIDIISNHAILNSVDKHLQKKEDCNKFTGFEKFIHKRLKARFEADYFIEGHFHQNKSFYVGDMYYINLAAFACNQRYFSIKYSKDNNILEEKIFLRENENG
ncbi:metallophosphoesterase [Sulfurimonas sp.]|uniref:UDP-2,3-diacylglucosamine diphosphatase n=1 Tax=Sulfurimonas sp. TaxID=2022749 RepID=UPI00261D6EE9|nr:metallophosphoesterase [Sulfurimonas sp.]